MNKKLIILTSVLALILLVSGCQTMPSAGNSYDMIRQNARYSANHTLCLQIDNEDYRNFCFGVVKKDISFCDNIKDIDIKDRCYFELPLEFDVCNKITDDNSLKGECMLNYALVTQNASFCETIPDAIYPAEDPEPLRNREENPTTLRDNCYLGIRLKTNDTSLCDNIIIESNKQYCLNPSIT